MTPADMARRRWEKVDAAERSRLMRALALRRWERGSAQRPHSMWDRFVVLKDRLDKVEAVLSGSTNSHSGFNARLLERK